MSKIFFLFIGFVLYFPAWIFKSGLKASEIIIFSTIFLFIPLVIHYLIFKSSSKNFNKKIFYLYISLIFVYSLDQNYGIMSHVDIIPNFLNINPYALHIYLSSLFILLFVLLIIFLFIQKFSVKGIKVLFAFTIVAVILNLTDNRNHLYFKKNFYKESSFEKTVNKDKEKTLIILLDEVSGIESYESNHQSGKIAKEKIQKFFNDWKFISYPNAYSLNQSSATSIPLLLNFLYNETKMDIYKKEYVEENTGKLINVNKEYFLSDNELKENKFFDQFSGEKITVFQSMSINFCNNIKVVYCLQYNPFKTDYDYMNGVKNKRLSRIISLWKLQGSIISNYIWRLLRISLIDNTLDPYGEKMTIDSVLNDVAKYTIQSETDLIFFHTLFSHNPYGFDENCNYDGSKSMNQYKHDIEWKTSQNNIERICVFKKLEKLFNILKSENSWEKLDVVVLSDHGSRISKDNFKMSYLSSIFAIKSDKYKIFNDKLSTQFLFSKYLNINHNKLNEKKD